MSAFHLSDREVSLILLALDALEDEIGGEPYYLVQKIRNLKTCFAMRLSGFTGRELRNVAEGLRLLLRENPLDWEVSQLLTKLEHQIANPGQ